MTKKYLDIEVKAPEYLDIEDLSMSCKDIIELMTKYIVEYGEAARIDIESYGYEGGVDVELRYIRKETEAERDKRLFRTKQNQEREQARLAIKEANDLKMYIKLKEKFGEVTDGS